MKKLIIAEKPSVARDLANALGKVPKKEDHFENDEWIIIAFWWMVDMEFEFLQIVHYHLHFQSIRLTQQVIFFLVFVLMMRRMM